MNKNIFIRKAVFPISIVILAMIIFMVANIMSNEIPNYIEVSVFIMLFAVIPLIGNNYYINSIVENADYDKKDLERDKEKVKISIYMTLLIYLIITIINLVTIWNSIINNKYIFFIFLIITIVLQVYSIIKFCFNYVLFFSHYYELEIINKITKRLPCYIMLYISTYIINMSLPLMSSIFN